MLVSRIYTINLNCNKWIANVKTMKELLISDCSKQFTHLSKLHNNPIFCI